MYCSALEDFKEGSSHLLLLMTPIKGAGSMPEAPKATADLP